MVDLLPTVYHGFPSSDEDTRIVDDAIQIIVGKLNAVPYDRNIPLRVIGSVLLTFCCAQDDPVATFEIIGRTVARAINAALMKPEGSG